MEGVHKRGTERVHTVGIGQVNKIGIGIGKTCIPVYIINLEGRYRLSS